MQLSLEHGINTVKMDLGFRLQLVLTSIYLFAVIIMAVSRFHRNHHQHISISQDLCEDLKKTGKDLQNQISNLDEKSNQIIMTVINIVVSGVHGVIPNLQEVVIKSNAENANNADLKDVVKKLSQYSNEMVQGYNSDSSTLKQKFQIFVQNILLQGELLLNIIKEDSLHDFKHELVENLKDLMYAVQRSQTRIIVENYNQKELKQLVERIQNEYFKDISMVETCSDDVLQTVIINTKYNVKHVLQLAYYLNKVGSNYAEIEIQNKILEAANLLNAATTAVILMHEKLSDTKQAVKVLSDYSLNGWDAVRRVFQFIDNTSLQNLKKSENLQDVVKEAASYGVVINSHLGRYIKKDGLFVQHKR